VAGRRRVHRLLLADNTKGSNRNGPGAPRDLESVASRKQIAVEWVPSSRLDVVTRVGHHHQGVAAEVSPFVYSSLADVEVLCREAGQEALVLLLDQVQDPQNFGTLLRTAEAVGVTAVVMLDRRQVEVTPAVVNASSGAVEYLQVCLANNLPRAIESLQEAGLWVYALHKQSQMLPFIQPWTSVALLASLWGQRARESAGWCVSGAMAPSLSQCVAKWSR